MARTKTEIKKQITDAFTQNEHIISAYKLDTTKSFEEQFSLVSFENTIFEIFAIVLFLFEKIFDQHRKEISEQIRTQKIFSLPWYRDMALRFQYGFTLVYERDYYDNTGKTDEEISQSKIVKYAAISEIDNVLILKIATEKNGELQRINDDEETAFAHYMNRVKAAGVEIRIINAEPDLLSIDMVVLYDPLVMKKDGTLIQNPSEKPVETAIKEYLKLLPFNGELVLAHLTDHLQKVQGVAVPEIYLAQSKWVDDADYQPISIKVIPNSGYFKLSNLNIRYEPNI